MERPEFDTDVESRFALAISPLMREIGDYVKSKLPPGTDFGVMVVVPGTPEGRVIALTTDRERVAFAVGQWVITAIPRHRP